MVPGSIPGGVTWDFFHGSFQQNHVPWGRLIPGISPGVKVAGAFGWRPTTLVVPKVEKIRGHNLPRTPRATSVCCRIPLLTFYWGFSVVHLKTAGMHLWRISSLQPFWRCIELCSTFVSLVLSYLRNSCNIKACSYEIKKQKSVWFILVLCAYFTLKKISL
jgi:hypothetical protein